MAAEEDFGDGAMDFGFGDVDVEEQEDEAAAVAVVENALVGLAITEQPEQQDEPKKQEAALIPTPTSSLAPPALIPTPAPQRPPPLDEFLEAKAPEELICPLALHLLDDPVTLLADGITYSRAAIEQHLEHCRSRACVCGCGRASWLVGAFDQIFQLTQPNHHTKTRNAQTSGDKPLTSPVTNLEIDPTMPLLAPAVLVRSFVIAYKEGKARKWEAAMAQWREQQQS